tara:strand:+ start:342 stop:557 length:216 start_codon:yes stop_codon:yes gene_type:complete
VGNDNPLILKITNIIWMETIESEKKLPEELKLQWGNKEWNYDQVSNWLNNYFNATIDSFDIKELDDKKSPG